MKLSRLLSAAGAALVVAALAVSPALVAAHLEDCPPCADELEGLLAAIMEPCDD